MKSFLKFLLTLLLILVVAFGAFVGWLTAVEYRPADVESLELRTLSDDLPVLPDRELSILCWNIGYCGLGQNEDFFMDGGTKAKPDDKETVNTYLNGIAGTLDSLHPDLTLLQETDVNSARTYSIDEAQFLARGVSAFALNYSCPFVPVPFPPMGKVNSGLFTTTDYELDRADRVALPCPFSWPLRVANLKRCLLVTHLPVEGNEHELVLVNLHLEAYDDGEGKIAQTRQLMSLLQEEYEKGSYVIAGGDFNQVFPGALEKYPNAHPELWSPGILEEASLPEGFSFAFDLSAPTCRLLNQPYDPSDTVNTQHYVIDGFIVSPNVTVNSVEVQDCGFAFSDHNPVLLNVSLG